VWWLKPIILDIRGAEDRRIAIQGEPRKKFPEIPSHPVKAGCGGTLVITAT
jgi:hypothetical protein